MADVIPFGQPILLGHHSEKSDRSYRARIDSHHRKGVEAYQRAKDLKSRLEGSEKLQAKQENPGALAKKVDKFETELRRLKLHEHWYQDKNEFEQKVADLEEKVAYWKQVLADVGGLKITSKDVKLGDLVKYLGTWYKAKKVNPKPVTIEVYRESQGCDRGFSQFNNENAALQTLERNTGIRGCRRFQDLHEGSS